MCGIAGVVVNSNANQALYDALTVLQHRGQDAAGIMTCHEGKLFLKKANGLVRDVINTEDMLQLTGNIGIAHLRYPTAGTANADEAQPFYVNSPYGLAIVHNGNLVNAQALKKGLITTDRRHLNTHSDSEVLLNVFAHELQSLEGPLTPHLIFKAICGVNARCQGAYAAIILIVGYGLVAFRDPYGIRPLILGRRESSSQTEYLVASESVALDSLGYQIVGDIAPGEAVFIQQDSQLFRQYCANITVPCSPCLFEYIYLARPDSILDNISVYKFRTALGVTLAKKVVSELSTQDIDVVIPIPETSCSIALSLAQTLGIPYREGFVKNRYIGRTFIMPGQAARRKSVRQKLNTIPLEFHNKNVLLVDDSIVRGTTSTEIVAMAKEAGARAVYFASAAPEIRYPNVYGIDIPAAQELAAHNRTVEDMAKMIGVNHLIFQNLPALYEIAKIENPQFVRFEDSVFTGNYITGGVNPDYLKNLASHRGEPIIK